MKSSSAPETGSQVHPDAPSPAVDGLSYEAATAELETLVASMEGGKLSLEASLAAYQRGTVLLRHCQSLLDAAEERVRILENPTADALPQVFDPATRS